MSDSPPFLSAELIQDLKKTLDFHEETLEKQASPFQQESGIDKPPSFVSTVAQEEQERGGGELLSFEELPLAPELLAYPFNFNFYQAVLIFLWLADKANWIRRLRFKSHHSLAFPPSELVDVTLPPSRDLPIEMTVSFMGLISHGSIMPTPYLEYILDDRFQTEGSLLDFLDIFNDRVLSLLVKSKLRRKLSLSLQVQTVPPVTRFLSALTGPLTPIGIDRNDRLASIQTLEMEKSDSKSSNRIRWPRCLLLTAFLTRHTASVYSLSRLIQAYTNIPVRIEEFQGECRYLESNQRTVMGRRGYNRSLGRSFTLGFKVWLADSGVNIIFDVYKKEKSISWFTNRNRLMNLRQLIMHHIGFPCHTFHFIFILGGENLSAFRLSAAPEKHREISQRLGVASVLFSRRPPEQIRGKLSHTQLKRITQYEA